MSAVLAAEKSNQAPLVSLMKKDGVRSWLNGDNPANSRPCFFSLTRLPITPKPAAGHGSLRGRRAENAWVIRVPEREEYRGGIAAGGGATSYA